MPRPLPNCADLFQFLECSSGNEAPKPNVAPSLLESANKTGIKCDSKMAPAWAKTGSHFGSDLGLFFGRVPFRFLGQVWVRFWFDSGFVFGLDLVPLLGRIWFRFWAQNWSKSGTAFIDMKAVPLLVQIWTQKRNQILPRNGAKFGHRNEARPDPKTDSNFIRKRAHTW